jgi:hypothetical protein
MEVAVWDFAPFGTWRALSCSLTSVQMHGLGVGSLMRRAASLLLGCWLAVFAAELPAIHVCPVHSAGQAVPHASHHGQHPPGHNHCTCPGACCPGTRAQLATTTPTLVSTRVVRFVEPDLMDRGLVRSVDVQVALPPSLGPPPISG